MSPRSGGGFASALPGPEHRASPPGLPDFIAEVRDALDASGVLTDPVDREAYATPWRGTPGRTPVVVRPATTAAVAEVVQLASRHRVRLIPQGANSGLVEASVPDRYGHMVVLSLERLRSRLEVDVDDRTVIADAGVRLSTLNEALAPHGLSLPIDLGSDPSLGGMVSTNTGGARMIHHGDLRRHLLGLEVVLAEPPGAVLDDLGALRKNNTSPKVSDWFIGAAGRFGIVTAVALEVAAIDRDRATAFLVPADDRAAVTITAALERALGHRLRAVEAMDAQALGLAAGEPGVHNPFGEDAPPPLRPGTRSFRGGGAGASARRAARLGIARRAGRAARRRVGPPASGQRSAGAVRHRDGVRPVGSPQPPPRASGSAGQRRPPVPARRRQPG